MSDRGFEDLSYLRAEAKAGAEGQAEAVKAGNIRAQELRVARSNVTATKTIGGPGVISAVPGAGRWRGLSAGKEIKEGKDRIAQVDGARVVSVCRIFAGGIFTAGEEVGQRGDPIAEVYVPISVCVAAPKTYKARKAGRYRERRHADCQ